MTYEELKLAQNYSIFTFYRGTLGGLCKVFEVFAKTLESAKEIACMNGIKRYDFVFETHKC